MNRSGGWSVDVEEKFAVGSNRPSRKVGRGDHAVGYHHGAVRTYAADGGSRGGSSCTGNATAGSADLDDHGASGRTANGDPATRSASYSDVYSGLRNWWHVLPDGSNPLAVFVQEFEATGVNAGSYASLAGQQAHRSATVDSLQCDSELAKVRERPAPWDGLHVCTVFVQVVEESASAYNTYSAPVSVMVNCPPAPTAPADSCVMVGFYAASSRIVY